MRSFVLKTVSVVCLLAVTGAAFGQAEMADAAAVGNAREIERLLKSGADGSTQGDGARTAGTLSRRRHWPNADEGRRKAGLATQMATMVAGATRGRPRLFKRSQRRWRCERAVPLAAALMLAARAGSVDAVRVLLEHGADVNASESERGTTALMQAADQGHADVLKQLIDAGAKVAAVSRPVMRDGRSAALGNSEDPRPAVRQQAIAALCEAKKPDLDQVRSSANCSRYHPASPAADLLQRG